MAHYATDDEALIALARQLADAYGEARTRADQDYACDEIDGYLSDHRSTAPGEALIALLDLPFTAETFPLIDEVQVTLASRGSAVVEELLSAAMGLVYDPDGPAPERAAETLRGMDPREASLGLVRVLRDTDVWLKDAAVDMLVAIGGVAEPDLVAAAGDPLAQPWVQAALAQLRIAREAGEDAGDGPPS
jgi:hypothetical protein